MKNILKTLVISFASIVMFTTQSNAGEMTVTGTAKATYNIISGGNQASAGNGIAKAIGIANGMIGAKKMQVAIKLKY